MVTMKDIARETGFSVMTVSRAINEPNLVKPDTCEKIRLAADKLGYVQNRMARSLVTGRAYNICVYIPPSLEATDTFVAQTVSTIGERLGMLGYSLVVRREMTTDDNYDGVIAVALNIEDEEDFIRFSASKPMVLYGNSDKFTNWVDVDNYRGMYKMGQYLLQKGYSDIAYIGLGNHENFVRQRKMGLLDALADGGVHVPEDMILVAENTEYGGFVAAQNLLNKRMPRMIVCATDLIAVGCIHYLQRNNISVPEQVAVSGFDGFGFERMVSPNIATIKQPLSSVGIKLADAVVEMISGKKMSAGIYVEPVLQEGKSV